MPECRRFFDRFEQHWKAATGLAAFLKRPTKEGEAWNEPDFVTAIEKAGIGTIRVETVRWWKNRIRWPQEKSKDAILKVFFPVPNTGQRDAEADRQSTEMEAAWTEGQAAANRSRPAARQDSDEAEAVWIASGTPFKTAGLARIDLIREPPNEPDTPWRLLARLRLGTAKHEATNSRPRLFIALRTAFLTVRASGHRVVPGSLIAERAPHGNFRPQVDGVDVIGPRACEVGCLHGDPLGDEEIARIEATANRTGEESVTVELYAFKDSFAVSLKPQPRDSDDSDVAADLKDAVLNALISKGRRFKDDQGRALLARDTLKREARE